MMRTCANASGASPKSGPTIVAIDHHAARLYHDLGGSQPEADARVKPDDPHGFHRHLIHRKEAHYQGERVPEETSFYDEVAKNLVPAQEIVLVGHGTGKSSALRLSGGIFEDSSSGDLPTGGCDRDSGSICPDGARDRNDRKKIHVAVHDYPGRTSCDEVRLAFFTANDTPHPNPREVAGLKHQGLPDYSHLDSVGCRETSRYAFAPRDRSPA